MEKINAVLWFSDMTGYTRLSETVRTDHLIPLLNDYAEVVICAVQQAGGDVLKLVGDGVLAIFAGAQTAHACEAAMRAERDMRGRLADLADRRLTYGLPVADIHLGLHVGDVFYGNIGSPDRLDFTVVGQAVNEVSRISAMCQSAGRAMLCSEEFASLLPRLIGETWSRWDALPCVASAARTNSLRSIPNLPNSATPAKGGLFNQ